MRIKSQYFIIGLSAILSGALSGYFLLPANPAATATGVDWGLIYGPGIFFGLVMAAICLWLYRGRWRWSLPRALAWAAVSVVSWRLAIIIALSGGNNNHLTYPLAGLLGSTVLAAAFWILVYRLRLKRLLFVPVAGAALGWAMSYIIGNDALGGQQSSFMLAFIVWQVGVALVLIEPPANAELPTPRPAA